MLVKVALSYYMEGEHSQGASNPRVSGLGASGAWEIGSELVGFEVELRVWAFDSAKV